MNFDPSTISPKICYQLLTHAVVPRPIAWISTLSADGINNLAPFSFFTVASCNPPVLAFTQVNPRDGHEKDTLRNLRETNQCVVNVVSLHQAAPMNASSAEYPVDVSEFAAVGIAPADSLRVAPPGVAEAEVRFECLLREILCISAQPSGGHLVLLDVLNIQVRDGLLRDEQIDPARLDAIGKLGGDHYTTTRDLFEMARPQPDRTSGIRKR